MDVILFRLSCLFRTSQSTQSRDSNGKLRVNIDPLYETWKVIHLVILCKIQIV